MLDIFPVLALVILALFFYMKNTRRIEKREFWRVNKKLRKDMKHSLETKEKDGKPDKFYLEFLEQRLNDLIFYAAKLKMSENAFRYIEDTARIYEKLSDKKFD